MNLNRVKTSKLASIFIFLLLWFLISGGIFATLYFSGLLPDYVRGFISDASEALITKQNPEPGFSKDNVVIIIPKISLMSPVIFPTSTEIKVLDKALYGGVVHYPESVLPGENGNIFIFGHSTGRPFVHNPAFTAFTNIHKLEAGDDIYIRSTDVNYHYRVASVENVDPKETKIYLSSNKPKLTLSTCWPVGEPINRTMVEAEFIGKSFLN